MNLKKAMAHEVRAVFCNPREFGEEIVIDDITTVAVISHAMSAVTDAMQQNPFAVRPQLRVSVCASDFPLGYPHERTVIMDGTEYYVMHKQKSGALLTLTLQQEA